MYYVRRGGIVVALPNSRDINVPEIYWTARRAADSCDDVCAAVKEGREYYVGYSRMNPSHTRMMGTLRQEMRDVANNQTSQEDNQMPVTENPLKLVSATPVIDSQEANKVRFSFDINFGPFASWLTPDIIKNHYVKKVDAMLGSTLEEMMKTEEFKEFIKPKLKETIYSMSLDEILGKTGKDINDIVSLFED